MTQHWRRSADGHIDAGDLDASDGPGPGTESNRARTARGGLALPCAEWPVGNVVTVRTGDRDVSVTVEAGETEEQAIARAQQLAGLGEHERALASERVPMTMSGGRPISGHREMVAAYGGTGRCPTPDEAERLYGRGSLPPMTWGGVPVPFERVALPPAAPQPDPAPGQVWLPPVGEQPTGWLAPDGTLTVDAVADDGQEVRFAPVDPGRSATYVHAPTMARWTCIGVTTPNGRVMVGDGWAFLGGPEQVVTSVDAGGPRFANGAPAEPLEGSGWTRTRYAPARAGERYRAVVGRTIATVCQADATRTALRFAGDNGPPAMDREAGWAGDPAQWERLDPGACDDGSFRLTPEQIEGVVAGHMGVLREHQRIVSQALAAASPLTATGEDLDRQARLYGIERRPAQTTAYRGGTDRETDESLRARCVERLGLPTLDARPRADHYTLPPLDGQRTLTLAPGSRLTPIGDGRTFRIEPEAAERDTLTLQAPARDLRALADAVGRALESAAGQLCHFAGHVLRVQRDELLFTPTYSTGSGASLAGDTRALAALRRCLLDAMASDDGRATLAQWGAKGPRVEVRREYRFEPAPAPDPDPSPTRYDGANGGADQWRWGVGE